MQVTCRRGRPRPCGRAKLGRVCSLAGLPCFARLGRVKDPSPHRLVSTQISTQISTQTRLHATNGHTRLTHGRDARVYIESTYVFRDALDRSALAIFLMAATSSAVAVPT